MGTFFKGLLVVITIFGLIDAGIIYEYYYENETPRMSEKAIENMVGYALGLDDNAPYFRARVNVYGRENYCVVTLFRSDSYLAEVFRL